MTNRRAVVLKKNRDRPIRNRHHWIFSGAIKTLPDFADGEMLPVESDGGDLLGYAYFNKKSAIVGRMVSFGSTTAEQAVDSNLESAIALRKKLVEPQTNAYRLINGEGDSLPGLVVDRYGDVLVIQIATLGMEKLKPLILDRLVQKTSPRSIYEKSDLPTRLEEGLLESEGLLYGEAVETVEIVEDGLRYFVQVPGSQKTGFFLDLREMRRLVRTLAQNRRVLNCFSYTGAFSVAALAGGATRAEAVDTSEGAIALARQNCALNGFSAACAFHVADVFEFLRRGEISSDFIILDPPAFAKKKADVVAACRGYKDINRLAMLKIEPRGLLLTFSCSYYVDAPLFQQVIFQAAAEASRRVRILQRHHLAFDHPVNIYHPESDYLKSLLLYVE
jgi:23S rRNA (cytosine1962-C5)-methyltransferase